MTINRIVSSFAGFMILLSLTFAQISGQIHLQHVSWLWVNHICWHQPVSNGFHWFLPAS